MSWLPVKRLAPEWFSFVECSIDRSILKENIMALKTLAHRNTKPWGQPIVVAALLLASLGAQAVTLPEVAKRGRVVVGFTKERAVEHCYKQGKRLPSVRELATWAQQRGALGIQESPNKALAYPLEVDLMQRKGFDAVYLHRSDAQTVVDFYFNPKGFKRNVRGSLGKTRIWADDVRHVDGRDAYSFTPGYPMFRADSSLREFAVVCI